MRLRELSRYLTHYQHLHDYVWYMLRESDYQYTEPFCCSDVFREAKRFRNQVSQDSCHFLDLSDSLSSDKEFVGYIEKINFLRSLTMSGDPYNTLSHIFLVVNLAKKLTSDGRQDLVKTLIMDTYPKLFHSR